MNTDLASKRYKVNKISESQDIMMACRFSNGQITNSWG